MAKVEVKTVKLSEIKLNPDNPRTISKKDMDLLVKSLKDFPEMLNIREIVVDETMTILGGNMRYMALKKSGAKECTAKIVSGLTPEQKREFVIKDNGGFGKWDMDALANAWGDLPLIDWGINLPKAWTVPEQEKESIISKNFNQGKGQDETEVKELAPGKYPVTFILDQGEWEAWEAVKNKLRLKDDKAALLKIIGGKNA
ncbi:MAG: ParB N-terminal domain-containing protein [Smithella sp.]